MAQFSFFEVNGDPLTANQLRIGTPGVAQIEDDDGDLEPETTDSGPQFSINGVDFFSSAYPDYSQTGNAVEIYTANIIGSGGQTVTFAYLTAANDGVDDAVNRIVVLTGTLTQGQRINNINLSSGNTDVPYNTIPSFICFTPGALIACPSGPRPVESLEPGDLVITKDHGLQAIRWVGAKKLTGARLQAYPNLAPIRIRAGALGRGLPERDMWVSPQHRMMLTSGAAQLMFASREVLIPAKALVNGTSITTDRSITGTTYVHMLFDRHEIVFANGAETESFHPGSMSMSAMDAPAREELFAIFPELAASPMSYGPAARRALTPNEARPFLPRHTRAA